MASRWKWAKQCGYKALVMKSCNQLANSFKEASSTLKTWVRPNSSSKGVNPVELLGVSLQANKMSGSSLSHSLSDSGVFLNSLQSPVPTLKHSVGLWAVGTGPQLLHP